MKTTLIYKYRLDPTSVQEAAIRKTAASCRRVWGALTSALRWAEHEYDHGRKASLLNRLEQIRAMKGLTGPGKSAKIQRWIDEGLTMEAAKLRYAREQLDKYRDTYVRKDGTKARRFSKRLLAIEFAAEVIGAQINKFDLPSKPFWNVITSFRDSTQNYPKGSVGRPRHKGYRDNIAMQMQVQPPKTPLLGAARIDMSPICGDACSAVSFIEHRPLPAEAVIKRVGVIQRPTGMYLAIFVDLPVAVAQKDFPSQSGAIAGIDPGRKTAITYSSIDGAVQGDIQPPICRDKALMRLQARLQRKLDRQRRLNNPDNYDEKGSVKCGVRLKWTWTENMTKTQDRLNEISRRITDARTEHYRMAARGLLSRFDIIGIGHCKGAELRDINEKERGKKTNREVARANRKDTDNAISSFEAILKDYAKRSAMPKTIIAVNEAYTTRQCLKCESMTGPTSLAVREWTCSCCGTHWTRDGHAAQAIAQRAAKQLSASASADHETTGTHPVSKSGSSARRSRRPDKRAATAVDQKSVEATRLSCHESDIILAASAAMPAQYPTAARAMEGVVTQEVGLTPDACGDTSGTSL